MKWLTYNSIKSRMSKKKVIYLFEMEESRMRKRLGLFLLTLTMFTLVACGERNVVDQGEKETEVQKETVKEINWYDASLDENIYWDAGRGTSWYTIDNGFGKIGHYDTADCILEGREKTSGDQLLPVYVSETSGNSTYTKLYENYIKPLNVKNEFFGLTDDEINSTLTEIDEYLNIIRENRKMYNPEAETHVGMCIFITSDDFIKFYEAGCPEDMKIIYTWLEKDSYSRFDEDIIEGMKEAVVTSRYRDDLYNGRYIWYDGDTELECELIYSKEGDACWPKHLNEMFDEAKKVCDESERATEIYQKMKYVLELSVKTEKDLEAIQAEFIDKLDIEWNKKSMKCQNGIFSCIAYMTEKEILSFDAMDVFEEAVLLEPAFRPEKIMAYGATGDAENPLYYVDEKDGKSYWDWQSVYENYWTEDYSEYDKADYLRSDLIWFLPTDVTGLPSGYMVETDTKGVHTSTYVYSQFEYARTKYNTEKKLYNDMKYAMDVTVKTTHDTDYLYDNYIKSMGVETQFDGMTDEEAKAWLREKYNKDYYYPIDDENWFTFKVYIIEEEFYQIKPFEDYLNVLISDREEEFVLTEKYIDIYEYELIPVAYLDQETREMKHEYFTKNEARQLVKETHVYWDWELMNKQMWE